MLFRSGGGSLPQTRASTGSHTRLQGHYNDQKTKLPPTGKQPTGAKTSTTGYDKLTHDYTDSSQGRGFSDSSVQQKNRSPMPKTASLDKLVKSLEILKRNPMNVKDRKAYPPNSSFQQESTHARVGGMSGKVPHNATNLREATTTDNNSGNTAPIERKDKPTNPHNVPRHGGTKGRQIDPRMRKKNPTNIMPKTASLDKLVKSLDLLDKTTKKYGAGRVAPYEGYNIDQKRAHPDSVDTPETKFFSAYNPKKFFHTKEDRDKYDNRFKGFESKKSDVEQGVYGNAGSRPNVGVSTATPIDAEEDYEGQSHEDYKEQFKHEKKKPKTSMTGHGKKKE